MIWKLKFTYHFADQIGWRHVGAAWRLAGVSYDIAKHEDPRVIAQDELYYWVQG